MAYIQVDDDALDNIIKEKMLTSISYLLKDIEEITKTKQGYVFSKDYKVDLLKLNALIDAYKLILVEHYGVTLERT